jgi:hypothetical protein
MTRGMFPPKLIVATLAVAFTAITLPSLQAQVSPVSMRVEQVNATDPEKHTTTQRRSLKVHLSNSSGQDFTGLRVKYYYFTKDVKDRDVVMKETGEKTADVPARKTEIVETPVIKATFTDAHSSGGGGNKGNNRNDRNQSKRVPASGEKVVGYGVQLYQGDKMLTEYFSQPSLKTMVGGRTQ